MAVAVGLDTCERDLARIWSDGREWLSRCIRLNVVLLASPCFSSTGWCVACWEKRNHRELEAAGEVRSGWLGPLGNRTARIVLSSVSRSITSLH